MDNYEYKEITWKEWEIFYERRNAIHDDMTREHICKKDEIVNNNFTLKHDLIDGHQFYSCGYCGSKVFTNRSKKWVEELYSLLSDINMLY